MIEFQYEEGTGHSIYIDGEYHGWIYDHPGRIRKHQIRVRLYLDGQDYDSAIEIYYPDTEDVKKDIEDIFRA